MITASCWRRNCGSGGSRDLGESDDDSVSAFVVKDKTKGLRVRIWVLEIDGIVGWRLRRVKVEECFDDWWNGRRRTGEEDDEEEAIVDLRFWMLSTENLLSFLLYILFCPMSILILKHSIESPF